MQTLNATLLGARSATFKLEAWCGEHGLAEQPLVRARLDRTVRKEPTPDQRARLRISPDEPVKYRHVELACGSVVLSEADNWYVPARLTSADEFTLLETTDTAFGRAVQDLKPFRQTFETKVLWHPLPLGWERMAPAPDHAEATLAMPAALFEHRALLFTSDQMPFSEVDETYRREVLSFGPPR